MIRREQRISPQGFSYLQEKLLEADLLGYGPDEAARYALSSIGLWPKNGTETVFIVDYNLRSCVYPFEKPCSVDLEEQALSS